MSEAARHSNDDEARITLALLDSVERHGHHSQRLMASELGIALGLVNTYVKRCIRKGLIKARQAPARRFIYYLTPKGFAEKSRLTLEYLSVSFEFFRNAKADCTELLAAAQECGMKRIALAGKSDLAEIALLCASDTDVELVAVIDRSAAGTRYVGLPVLSSLGEIAEGVDAVLVTDLVSAAETRNLMMREIGANRVLVPKLLRLQSKAERVS